MKIFSNEQIRSIDKYTIENEPVMSIDLMERAAGVCFEWIKDHYSKNHDFTVFAGPGNNGGDGLAIARMLADDCYRVHVYIVHISDNYSNDFIINYDRLITRKKVKVSRISDESALPSIGKNDIIIDAIFGSGLSRPLDGLSAKTVLLINNSGNTTISIDIPSGLFAGDNTSNVMNNVVRANHVLSLQFPKLAFMFPGNSECVKEFTVLPIGLHEKIIGDTETDYYYTTSHEIRNILKKRNKFSHKGNFGHGLLISGSYGKMGAAILASRACIKTGIGLLTAHIPSSGYRIIQVATPETMVSIDKNKYHFTGTCNFENYKAIAIGPGIGTDKETVDGFKKLVKKYRNPLVIDADAINILGMNKVMLEKLPKGSILTPHLKEFERIAGASTNDIERNKLLLNFAKKYDLIVVLKGAHTAIACPDGTCHFNSTGNPGMATAGSGDVLTGIILSLLAQGYSPQHSAIIGVFIHGLAGDIAQITTGTESLIASDIIENIGKAFKQVKGEI